MSALSIKRVGEQLREFWDEIEPAFSHQYDRSQIERWDGKGVGPGRCIAFEGFGISFSMFFGRIPKKEEH